MAIGPLGSGASGTRLSGSHNPPDQSPSPTSVRMGSGSYTIERPESEPSENGGCCPWFRRLFAAIRNFFAACCGRKRTGGDTASGSQSHPPSPASTIHQPEYDPSVEQLEPSRRVRHRPSLTKAQEAWEAWQ